MTTPGGGSLNTDFDLMTAVAAKIDARNDEIRSMLQAFIGRMTSVPASVWGGVAATRFRDVVDRWNAESTKLRPRASRASEWGLSGDRVREREKSARVRELKRELVEETVEDRLGDDVCARRWRRARLPWLRTQWANSRRARCCWLPRCWMPQSCSAAAFSTTWCHWRNWTPRCTHW